MCQPCVSPARPCVSPAGPGVSQQGPCVSHVSVMCQPAGAMCQPCVSPAGPCVSHVSATCQPCVSPAGPCVSLQGPCVSQQGPCASHVSAQPGHVSAMCQPAGPMCQPSAPFLCFCLSAPFFVFLCAWRVCFLSCWAAVAAAVAVVTSSGFSSTGKSPAPFPLLWATVGGRLAPLTGGSTVGCAAVVPLEAPLFFPSRTPLPFARFFLRLAAQQPVGRGTYPRLLGVHTDCADVANRCGPQKMCFSMLGCRESRFQGTPLAPTDPSSAPPCPDGRGGLVWIRDSSRPFAWVSRNHGLYHS